jgi:RNA polymerase sigma-70 factor (ECF subfamily)
MEGTQILCGVQAASPLEPTVSDDDFAHFYLKEYRALMALGVALTGSQTEAEELVQEALLRVCARWQRIARYERPGAFARRVLVNLATSRIRRVAAETRALTRIQRHAAATRQETEPLAHGPDLWAAVRSLPRRQAQVLVLYYAEDRPTAEIAAILGCSEGTVRTHMQAGRRSLAARLLNEENQRG